MLATLIVLAVIAVFAVIIYNKLVALKNEYLNDFAQIDVELKRRHDLIPNLVETAKAYMAHESETLEAVIAARNQAASSLKRASSNPSSASALDDLAKAEGSLMGALGKMNVVMEAYPDLKADENMRQLSDELSSTENRISYARQAFNDAVTAYNSYRQSFPNVLIANWLGHTQDGSLLEFADAEAIQEAPKVSF